MRRTMGHLHWRGFLAAALTVLCVWSASAGPEDGFLLFTDPEARFSVEFPKDWEWSIVAGSGEALVRAYLRFGGSRGAG